MNGPFYLEEEDNGFIEVCVAVIGNLDREVTITLSTSDITAESPGNVLTVYNISITLLHRF